MKRVCHLTSVHQRFDTRIFYKECKSLKNLGYDVHLIVGDGDGDKEQEGVFIHDVGRINNRILRMLFVKQYVYKKAVQLNADIYHFHDPELIPIGIRLIKLGKKVIYDVHEDVPAQILSKHYIPKFLRPLISSFINIYEKNRSRKFSAICTATEFIRDKFLKINDNTIDINNYPILGELHSDICWTERENAILYVGGINKLRGISEVIRSLDNSRNKIVFYLGGNFSDDDYEREIKSLESYKYVKYLGYVNKEEYNLICKKVKVGIIADYPIENYVNAYCTKMFEYMEASLPFICSNFPIWQDFINKYECGIVVDPFDINSIMNTIDFFIENNEVARRMGENGRRAILKKFNWSIEELKLSNIYKNLSNA